EQNLDDRADKQGSLEQRQVSRVNGLDAEIDEAGNAEESFEQQVAGVEERDGQHGVGQDWDHGVFQDVLEQHGAFAVAIRKRGSHVVLVDLIQHDGAIETHLVAQTADDSD